MKAELPKADNEEQAQEIYRIKISGTKPRKTWWYSVTINFANFVLAMHSALYSIWMKVLLYEFQSDKYDESPRDTHAREKVLH